MYVLQREKLTSRVNQELVEECIADDWRWDMVWGPLGHV